MPENIKQLKHVYEAKQNFLIIGLTGRTGSGCTTASSEMMKTFKDFSPPKPDGVNTEDKRKYKIVYNYSVYRWRKFIRIQVRDIITSFILLEPYDSFLKYMFDRSNSVDIVQLMAFVEIIKPEYDEFQQKRTALKEMKESNTDEIKLKQETAYKFYFEELPAFSESFKQRLNSLGNGSYTRLYQQIGDNIRSSGKPFVKTYSAGNNFSLALRVDRLIKILKSVNGRVGKDVFVVIDAMRNPFEADFFKERYTNFFLISINTPNHDRINRLQKFDFTETQIKDLDQKEYPKSLSDEKRFISQDIQRCIEVADIHINNPTEGIEDFNTLKRQLLYYITLIMHPGLVPPSKDERCMQIAYTAKLNSGCISRQVGAVITDPDYSIKAVGWNSTATGQVSCLLRNIKSLLNHEDKSSYSLYELNNAKFREKAKELYGPALKRLDTLNIKGYNISFCFKDIQNCVDEQKNQVHTRALHAEENSFLQITKYGGQGVKNGILYSTASPCELCSKKAVQLGISRIVYIDPYPGIAKDHLLSYGNGAPLVELYHGAIGTAYHRLYQPVLPYKDELSILLDLRIPNPLKVLQSEIEELKEKNNWLRQQLEEAVQAGEKKDGSQKEQREAEQQDASANQPT